MHADLSRCAIHTITTKPWSLEQAIEAYPKAGVNAITVWREALEPYGAKRAGELLRNAGMRVPALCGGGFFAARDTAKRQAARDDTRRVIDEAAHIGADMVTLICGAEPGLPLEEARQQIADGIAAVTPHAQAAKVHLAIEPLHPLYAAERSAINTMRQARRICESIHLRADDGAPVVGIACDIYHCWWDDTLEDEIAIAGAKGYLLGFQVCDWKVQQDHTLNDRGLMGEGCIDIHCIRSWVDRAGFHGFYEVEIDSSRYAAMDQERFLAKLVAAYQQYV